MNLKTVIEPLRWIKIILESVNHHASNQKPLNIAYDRKIVLDNIAYHTIIHKFIKIVNFQEYHQLGISIGRIHIILKISLLRIETFTFCVFQ